VRVHSFTEPFSWCWTCTLNPLQTVSRIDLANSLDVRPGVGLTALSSPRSVSACLARDWALFCILFGFCCSCGLTHDFRASMKTSSTPCSTFETASVHKLILWRTTGVTSLTVVKLEVRTKYSDGSGLRKIQCQSKSYFMNHDSRTGRFWWPPWWRRDVMIGSHYESA
jgi:hypothetical protein